MRTSSFPLVLLVTACGGAPEGAEVAGRANDERIACQTGEASGFELACTVRQTATEQGQVLTISDPSGGFRRLLIAMDGRGVVAADGAEPAVVTPVDGHSIEVALGGDRYRLPATVKSGATK